MRWSWRIRYLHFVFYFLRLSKVKQFNAYPSSKVKPSSKLKLPIINMSCLLGQINSIKIDWIKYSLTFKSFYLFSSFTNKILHLQYAINPKRQKTGLIIFITLEIILYKLLHQCFITLDHEFPGRGTTRNISNIY